MSLITMYANIAPFLQPIDEHLQTILRKLFANSCCLDIVVAEVSRSMVLLDSTPVEVVRIS